MKENASGYAVGTLPQCPDLLGRLLARGDVVSIERGLLLVAPASGKPVPAVWLRDNSEVLIRQILSAIGQDAYRYQSYTTGHYGPRRSAGLTLQFESVMAAHESYAIFNVELTRARNAAGGKKGEPLPGHQFRPLPKSHLAKFWQSTGITLRRLSAMADYMGRLTGLLFSASLTPCRNDGRLDAGSLKALNVAAASIRRALDMDNLPTRGGQGSDNGRTNWADKDIAQGQQPYGLQPDMATGADCYGNKVIRECGNAGALQAIPICKLPQDQSVDEWLADFNSVRAGMR